jgi:hypothetical protein
VVDVDGSTTDGGGCIYDTEPFSGFCSDGYKESTVSDQFFHFVNAYVVKLHVKLPYG